MTSKTWLPAKHFGGSSLTSYTTPTFSQRSRAAIGKNNNHKNKTSAVDSISTLPSPDNTTVIFNQRPDNCSNTPSLKYDRQSFVLQTNKMPTFNHIDQAILRRIRPMPDTALQPTPINKFSSTENTSTDLSRSRIVVIVDSNKLAEQWMSTVLSTPILAPINPNTDAQNYKYVSGWLTYQYLLENEHFLSLLECASSPDVKIERFLRVCREVVYSIEFGTNLEHTTAVEHARIIPRIAKRFEEYAMIPVKLTNAQSSKNITLCWPCGSQIFRGSRIHISTLEQFINIMRTDLIRLHWMLSRQLAWNVTNSDYELMGLYTSFTLSIQETYDSTNDDEF